VQEPEEYDPSSKKINDPVAYYRHKEAAVVEQYVKVSEAKVWSGCGAGSPFRPARARGLRPWRAGFDSLFNRCRCCDGS
jgi:hypothetical protein